MMMRNTAVCLLFLVAACGGDERSDDTMASADTGVGNVDASQDSAEETSVSDSETNAAPTFRDIRIAVMGEFNDTFDLNTEDGALMLPVPWPVEVTVFALDDTTEGGVLVVELIDAANGMPRPESDKSFRNGLWRITTELGPGMATQVRVTDQAGQQTVSEHVVRVPSLADAVVGDWFTPFFTPDQQVRDMWDETFDGDNGWRRAESDARVFQGAYSIDSDAIVLEESMLPSGVTRGLEKLTAALYVDAFYCASGPYRRSGEGTGLEGRWVQNLERATFVEGAFGEPVTETVELSLNDNGSWTETQTRGAETTVRSGLWRAEINENYVESLGNFLIREISAVDGESVTMAPDVDLYDIRAGLLLLSPRLRANNP